MYTVIPMSKEQAQSFYEKHMKLELKTITNFMNFLRHLFGLELKKYEVSRIVKTNYSYDDEDDIGFFSAVTSTGKRIECQVRSSEPCFVEFTGFGSIRYDIGFNIEELCPEMYEMLKRLCKDASNNFWNGAEI